MLIRLMELKRVCEGAEGQGDDILFLLAFERWNEMVAGFATV